MMKSSVTARLPTMHAYVNSLFDKQNIKVNWHYSPKLSVRDDSEYVKQF